MCVSSIRNNAAVSPLVKVLVLRELRMRRPLRLRLRASHPANDVHGGAAPVGHP